MQLVTVIKLLSSQLLLPKITMVFLRHMYTSSQGLPVMSNLDVKNDESVSIRSIKARRRDYR